MHKPLSYEEIYKIAEEISQLAKSKSVLHNTVQTSLTQFSLQFFEKSGGSRWLVFELVPAQPFILSTSSPITKKKTLKSPVQNFLQAHFKGLVLSRIMIAQKPNRNLKLFFENENDDAIVLEFQCFPHGQKIILLANGKHVVFPLSKKREDENITFVEVDPPDEKSWEFNEDLAIHYGLIKSASDKSAVNIANPTGEATDLDAPSLITKQRLKLETTIRKMEENKLKFFSSSNEKIHDLEAVALEMKMGKSKSGQKSGQQLDKTYAEIKKLKRGLLEFGERANRLAQQLRDLDTLILHGGSLKSRNTLAVEQKSENKAGKFTGSIVFIDQTWQLWVGRKATQNDELLKLGSPTDIWIHMRDYPGAHGLLRGPRGKDPTLEMLEFSCRVIAIFTQNKNSPFQDGEFFEFIVTPKKFVKKKKGMAPGRVIVERESVRRVAFKKVSFQTS